MCLKFLFFLLILMAGQLLNTNKTFFILVYVDNKALGGTEKAIIETE